jgi:hypothetical protein
MGKAAKFGCIGAAVVLLGGGGYGAYTFVHKLTGDSKPASYDASQISATPPAAKDAAKFAGAFLTTWAKGPAHYTGAASDTDSPLTARAALRGYHDGLKLTALSFSHATGTGADPKSSDGARVTFTVTAHVAGGTWSYPGALDVVQDGNGQKAVRWSPAVLYPGLTGDETLAAGDIPAPASEIRVLARDGRTVLSAGKYPSLADIIPTIARYTAAHDTGHGGSGGSGVAVLDASGQPVSAVKVFVAPTAPTVTTTIDAAVQATAEHAVLDSHVSKQPSSVVALDWHNGDILAIAYHGPNDDAINSAKAPGSTMKIITSAALFDHAGLNPGSLAPCAKTQAAAGELFKNEADVPANPHATVQQAFAESCNTAFIKDGFDYLVHDGDASTLHDEAQSVFGFGSWSIGGGVETADPSVPADPQGGNQAAQFIGQAQITVSPLILASVAATVRDTGFHQPIIVPGTKQVTADRQISATTAGYLRQMMRAVVTGGTAAPRLADLPDTGGKTGTAEEGDHTNGWLTAYNDRIAVASLVEGGSSGVDSAGYVVRAVLTSAE